MQERSHEFGRSYQRAVKRWLVGRTVFGLQCSAIGDAYDVTAHSASFGSKQFDLALALHKDPRDSAAGLAFVECKYRTRATAAFGGEFVGFVQEVARAFLQETPGRRRQTRFLFVPSGPPRLWDSFLSDRVRFLRDKAQTPLATQSDSVVAELAQAISVLVLTPDLLGEEL